MPPKKKTTKKKKSKAAEEEEDVEAPKPKKKEKPKSAREAMDMYDNTVDTLGSSKRKYNKDAGETELGCCGKFLRYLVIFINLFFIIIGFILLVYGAYVANNSTTATSFTGTSWAGFVVALGIFVMLIGIIGLVGAKWQNRVILVFYFIVIILLFILTLSCGAWILSLEGKESSLVTTAWNAAPSSLRKTAQTQYFCCGLNGVNDTTAVLPCPTQAGALPNSPVVTATQACLGLLAADVQTYYASFGALMLVVCFVLLADIGVTWWLFKVLNRLKART